MILNPLIKLFAKDKTENSINARKKKRANNLYHVFAASRVYITSRLQPTATSKPLSTQKNRSASGFQFSRVFGWSEWRYRIYSKAPVKSMVIRVVKKQYLLTFVLGTAIYNPRSFRMFDSSQCLFEWISILPPLLLNILKGISELSYIMILSQTSTTFGRSASAR